MNAVAEELAVAEEGCALNGEVAVEEVVEVVVGLVVAGLIGGVKRSEVS